MEIINMKSLFRKNDMLLVGSGLGAMARGHWSWGRDICGANASAPDYIDYSNSPVTFYNSTPFVAYANNDNGVKSCSALGLSNKDGLISNSVDMINAVHPSICADFDNNMYICGRLGDNTAPVFFYGNLGEFPLPAQTCFISKCTNGANTPEWAYELGGISLVLSITPLSSGGVELLVSKPYNGAFTYRGAEIFSASATNGLVLIKIGSSGEHISTFIMGTSASGNCGQAFFKRDAAGNGYLSGYTVGDWNMLATNISSNGETGNYYRFFVLKMLPNNTLSWVKQPGYSPDSYVLLGGMDVSPEGAAVVSGNFGGSTATSFNGTVLPDKFVIKLYTNGDTCFIKEAASYSHWLTECPACAFANNGDIYVGGSYHGKSLVFGSTIGTDMRDGVYIAKLSGGNGDLLGIRSAEEAWEWENGYSEVIKLIVPSADLGGGVYLLGMSSGLTGLTLESAPLKTVGSYSESRKGLFLIKSRPSDLF